MPATVFTEDNPTYQFFTVKKNSLTVSVKAANDAHIALSSNPGDEAPLIEVFLGGWENTKSAIRLNKEKPDKAEAPTPSLLSADEAKNFVLTWTSDGLITVQLEGEPEPFLSWKNDQPFEIRYIGVRTAWGATGTFLIDSVKEINTEDSFTYQWLPVHSAQLDLSVQAKNDAHIALTGPDMIPVYEIFLGGWNNTKCAIRYNQAKPDVAEADGCISDDEPHRFWVRLTHASIQVGRDGETEPVLSWTISEPIVVSHFGIRTSWGASGNWTLHQLEPQEAGSEDRPRRDATGDLQWVPATGGEVPEGALVGGEEDGQPLYIAKAVHEDATLPGKLLAAHNVAYVPWGGEEHGKEAYEVLVVSPDAVSWVDGTGDQVPANAVQGGTAEDGEVLYVGRADHEGVVTPGKFHPSHGKVYISYGGMEVGYDNFQVLVKN